MRSRLYLCIPSVLMAMGMVLGPPAESRAAFTLSVVISDLAGDPAQTFSGGSSPLLESGSIGTGANLINFTISATYNPAQGLFYTSIDATAVNGHANTLTMLTSGNMFVDSSGLPFTKYVNQVTSVTGSVGATQTAASVASTSYYNLSDALPVGTASPIGIGTIIGTDTSGTVLTTSTAVTSGNPFSMANSSTISFTQNNETVTESGQTTFGGSLTPNPAQSPAPPSVVLAIVGIPVFGLAWMVRRRRSRVEGAAPVMV